MEVAALISGIIALIAFFVMANNISALRDEWQNKNYNDALIDFHSYSALIESHYHEAGKALLKAYYSRMIIAKSNSSQESTQKQLEHDLGHLFKSINYETPTFKNKK